MDYKKLHKNTLAALQQMVSEGKITEEIARSICADFVKGSEDERMKDIITEALCTNAAQEEIEKYGINALDCVAWLEKQGEQQPSWNEDDENMLKVCLDFIDIHRATHPLAMKAYDWLKSLKPQPHWKPSERQMYILNWVANTVLWHSDSIVEKEVSKDLNNLYDDLKKL